MTYIYIYIQPKSFQTLIIQVVPTVSTKKLDDPPAGLLDGPQHETSHTSQDLKTAGNSFYS